MSKPTSKKELLDSSQKYYKALISLVDSYSEPDLDKEFPKGSLNRNIRDVITHLHHWHVMFLDWYKVGMAGEKPDMPAKGYTWQTLPALNEHIWKTYQDTDLKTARVLLDESYDDVYNIISHHTNEELFEKKMYHWTGSTSLGAYLISNASSHYKWAIKLIKKSMK